MVRSPVPRLCDHPRTRDLRTRHPRSGPVHASTRCAAPRRGRDPLPQAHRQPVDRPAGRQNAYGVDDDGIDAADPLDLDGFRPGFTENPYPLLARVRESAPVRQVTVLGLHGWLLTRYEDVLAALDDVAMSSDPRYANLQAQAWPQVAAGLRGPLARSLLTTDDP